MKTDVTFRSGDSNCAAHLYEPEGLSTSVIVMAHGLGAVKEMGLDHFAERFCESGWRVLLFDYRHFGASEGEPRQLLDIKKQRDDYRAAIAYARTLPGVENVALFGSSFSGGHVIAVAAGDPGIAAVAAQCPFTSGVASAMTLGKAMPAVVGRGLKDAVAAVRKKEPVRIPTAGKPGETALMNAPDVVPGYLSLVPDESTFENGVAARIALRIPLNNPGFRASQVKAPLFVAVCDKDTVAPAKATARLVQRAPRGEIHHYPVGHFDIYTGADRDAVLADEIAFFGKHLPR